MKLKYFHVLIVLFTYFSANSQTYSYYNINDILPANAQTHAIVIKQAKMLTNTLEIERNQNQAQKSIPGYRIQIFFATGRGAKEGAEARVESFSEEFPEIGAYISYFAPYFKVYVGNFRTKREAASYRLKILHKYPDAWIVKDQIEWPEL